MALPNAKVPVLLPDGSLSLPWRRWAENLSGGEAGTVTPAEFAALVALVALLEAQLITTTAEAQAALSAASTAQILSLINLGNAPEISESFIELETP